jgi:hypothetical protein
MQSKSSKTARINGRQGLFQPRNKLEKFFFFSLPLLSRGLGAAGPQTVYAASLQQNISIKENSSHNLPFSFKFWPRRAENSNKRIGLVKMF